MSTRNLKPVLAALLTALLAESASAITPINLGTLGPNSFSQNYSRGAKINRFGEVTGETTRPAAINQPFGYASPFMFSIFPSGQNGVGNDLNDVGQIVGYIGTPGVRTAFRHDNTGTTPLPTINPQLFPIGDALGTNNLDDVVGYSNSGGALPSQFGTFWAGGSTTAVQLPMNIARDINDSQLIVGDAFSTPSMAVAYDYVTQGVPTPMGTLGGNLSRAFAVNNLGQAVGYSADANNNWHAFIWDATGGMVDMGGASTGAIESRAFDINNHGTVVGELNFNGVFRAFCWSNGQFIDLNTLLPANSGWVLTTANGVNDQGWITGTGLFNGEQRAFLMKHVPEPSSLAVLATGLLLAARRR